MDNFSAMKEKFRNRLMSSGKFTYVYVHNPSTPYRTKCFCQMEGNEFALDLVLDTSEFSPDNIGKLEQRILTIRDSLTK